MTAEEHREPLSSEVEDLERELGTYAHHPLLHLPVVEQLNVFRVAVLYLVVLLADHREFRANLYC